MGQELLVVADLTTVWVITDLYEKDFAAVRVGTEASVVVPAAPETPRRGRIAYIDPRVDPATRTAKVRVEVPDRGDLKQRTVRLGAFVGDAVAVLGGLRPNERVVAEGSFFLRAEAARSRGGG